MWVDWLSVLDGDLEIGGGVIIGFVELQGRVLDVCIRWEFGGVEEKVSAVEIIFGLHSWWLLSDGQRGTCAGDGAGCCCPCGVITCA